MAINFIFSKDPNETHIMQTKSDDIEIMIGNDTDEIIEESLIKISRKIRTINERK